MTLLNRLYALHGRGAAALVGMALAALFMFVLFPAAAEKSGSRDNRVVDLQLASTRESFIAVLRRWSAVKGDAVGIMKRDNIIRLDLFFPAIYGLTLAFLYAAVSGRSRPERSDVVFFAIPLLAAGCDYIENTLHLLLLRGINTAKEVEAAAAGGAFSPGAILGATAAARGKYVLLALALVGLCRAVVIRMRD